MLPASRHSEGDQMTNETIRTKFEYVDDDEPEDPIGMLRDTIERLIEEFGEMDEAELKVAYGELGLELYRELMNARNDSLNHEAGRL